MRALSLVLLAACSRPVTPPVRAPVASDGEARQLLDRLTFGARPADVERVRRMGASAWLDEQLAPAPDPAAERALEPFRDALKPPADLKADLATPRELGGRLQMTALARHIAAERQVNEVLVDFWTNHFNVFALKGPVRWQAADFVESAIRPHALGKFQDLLVATARHPAMLLYLDNARPGLNENYARELLELHTVGVDAGYSQDDVRAAARVLSGWSVEGPAGGYRFRPRLHDRGEKVVLGERFAAGGGEDEGRRLLAFLAAHPATIRHVSRKLCQRLVADEPPPACVEAASRAWTATGGDIAAVVRAIAGEHELWGPAYRAGKVRTPLEYVAAAARALDADVTGPEISRALARLGQPLFLEPAPTGYAETANAWLSTSGMLARMTFAVALASNRLPGVSVSLERLFPEHGDALVGAVVARLLGGRASDSTLAALRAATSREEIVALALGSPEFQRQ